MFKNTGFKIVPPNLFKNIKNNVLCTSMFADCKNLYVIPDNILLSGTAGGKVNNVYHMFANCINLRGTINTNNTSSINFKITTNGFPSNQFWENKNITTYTGCFYNTQISWIIQEENKQWYQWN